MPIALSYPASPILQYFLQRRHYPPWLKTLRHKYCWLKGLLNTRLLKWNWLKWCLFESNLCWIGTCWNRGVLYKSKYWNKLLMSMNLKNLILLNPTVVYKWSAHREVASLVGQNVSSIVRVKRGDGLWLRKLSSKWP